ncbi:MAG: SPW repeat protein [Anditalea sp.]
MWAQIINTVIGIWIIIAPSVLSYSGLGTDNCHIVGPVIATFAIVACWEATRVVGKINIPLGLWFLVAPWVLGYEETLPIVNDMVCGALIIAFALVKGKVKGRFGGGWQAIRQSGSLHEREAQNEV